MHVYACVTDMCMCICNIVQLLRKQLVYNSLVASVLGRNPLDLQTTTSLDKEFMFEVTTQAPDKVRVTVDMQCTDNYLACEGEGRRGEGGGSHYHFFCSGFCYPRSTANVSFSESEGGERWGDNRQPKALYDSEKVSIILNNYTSLSD